MKIEQARHIRLSNTDDRTIDQIFDYDIDIVVHSESPAKAIACVEVVKQELNRLKVSLVEELGDGND